MGMDVYGLCPENKDGEYFRASLCVWGSLWMFICQHCDDILSHEEAVSGQYNYTATIGPLEAFLIATRLQTIIDSSWFKQNLESDPEPPSSDNSIQDIGQLEPIVRHFVKFTRSCGGFTIC